MKLGNLKPAPGSTHSRKRVGRGSGSGHGKTSCAGMNGQKARANVRAGFEGGQTPLHRRLPVRTGFRSINRKEYAVVNLGQLEVFEPKTVVTPDLLIEKRIIRGVKGGVKILGDGELSKPLTVQAHRFSTTAAEKINGAGGSAEVI